MEDEMNLQVCIMLFLVGHIQTPSFTRVLQLYAAAACPACVPKVMIL